MKFRSSWLAAIALLAASCTPDKPPAKQYLMHGKIVSVDQQSHLAKIDAGKIGDWMGPMTMDYLVPNKSDWEQIRAGQEIDAKVFVRGDEFWIADIHPAPASPAPTSK